MISNTIGDDYKNNAKQLDNLMKYTNDDEILEQLAKIKHVKKVQLSNYLKEKNNIDINPDSIFDIQVKRLHEYKRQQMNLLYIINKYQEIKAGKIPSKPITFIFGAKAAPAYTTAQDIIHAILVMQDIIKNDPDVAPYMNLVMLENYNVSLAEKVIPACDISEQISLASKEASGTGNMKFMLNGAVTLGTEDGANVEMHELVGDDNIYIFGKKSDEIIKIYKEESYNPRYYYDNNEDIKNAVDFLVSDKATSVGDSACLNRLRNELLNKDWFMTLIDFEDYKNTKERALNDYQNTKDWNKKALVNIAKAGYFSSDRTIKQYDEDIWQLTKRKNK
jgi:starch phosphorylase